jgi:hypothetical protein
MPALPRALTVFVSAAESRRDELLWRKLEAQLAILRKQGLIEIWDKGDIAAGADRTHAADTRLEAADIVLLLISPDFLVHYVGGAALERALARHEAQTAHVIPVILRPCLWQRAAFAKLQALPTDGEPVTSDKWRSQDAAFLVVAQGIGTRCRRAHRETKGGGAGTPRDCSSADLARALPPQCQLYRA